MCDSSGGPQQQFRLGDFFPFGVALSALHWNSFVFRLSGSRALFHHPASDLELSVRINDKPVGVKRLEGIVTVDLLRSDGHGFSGADSLDDRGNGLSFAPSIESFLHLLCRDLSATKQR